MDKWSEAAGIRREARQLIKAVIKNETRNCFFVYKGRVVDAPNGATCTVRLTGQNTTLEMPYSSACSSVASGDLVWVGVIGRNFRNAICWERIDFQ